MSDESIETNDNDAVRSDEALAQPRLARVAGGRFAPGQSGNRRGRPRKQPEALVEMMARVINEAVQLNRGGKVIEMSCGEAIFRAMCHKAMADPRLGKEVFKLVAPRESAIDPGEMDSGLAQNEVALENYFGRMRRQIQAEFTAASTAEQDTSDNDNLGLVVDPEDAP